MDFLPEDVQLEQYRGGGNYPCTIFVLAKKTRSNNHLRHKQRKKNLLVLLPLGAAATSLLYLSIEAHIEMLKLFPFPAAF